MSARWKIGVRRSLRGFTAPRLLEPEDLARLAAECGLRASGPAAARALGRLAADLEEDGSLARVRRGLYLNQNCEPRATLAEAAQRLRPGCVVSLLTVLGDSGVFNNYTHEVTAIVPFGGRHGASPSLGRVAFGDNVFHFHGMPASVLEACDPLDALDLAPYPRATKEAAMAHWAYLVRSPFGGLKRMPVDIDADLLDLERLARLSEAIGVRDEIEDWIGRARAYHDGLDGAGDDEPEDPGGPAPAF